jgi:hypothetical protein
MAKQDFLCPITHVVCKDCSLYRGRHYFMPFCKLYRERTRGSANPITPEPVTAESVQELNRMLEPWKTETALSATLESYRGVDIKITDMETDAVRHCRLEELEPWDWGNPEQVRLIEGRQVTSFDQLVRMVAYLKEEGYDIIDLFEGPRFMMLAGG